MRWSGQTSVWSQTLGALRLNPQLELTGRAGHCFSVRNTPDLRLRFSASGVVKNRRFTSQKVPNPASQTRREGERNPNPSLPLKLHRLRKCANTTKCTPPCACVLAFHKHFSKRYVSSLLDPNVYAQDIDLVALDSRANRDCPS
jgi:hypothetical protein